MCNMFIMSIHVRGAKHHNNMLSIHAIFCSMYYMAILTNIFEIVIRTDLSIHVAVDTSSFYCIFCYLLFLFGGVLSSHPGT